MARAVRFFRDEVAQHGGYLWRYSEDLEFREGEGKADTDTIWVQPPGTPSVGLAYLRAWRATGDREYLAAARKTGEALIRGQLRSGGWAYQIHFDHARRAKFAYRVEPETPGTHNTTTYDDDTTQAALRFLMELDRALDFADQAVHDAVRFGLDAVLKAQYPNGAWPQRYSRFPDPDKFPIRKASYPDDWPRTFPKRDYGSDYTFNDSAINDLITTLLQAARIYDEPRYRAAVERAGDFILLAQMPEPQPAWAQQYDTNMHPVWARRFEPPAVTGGESHSVMRSLLQLYRETGNPKWLEPLPRAIAYFRRSQLPDGRLARFYELHTNRPLYFTRQYELTYNDDDLPTHYAFKANNHIEAIAAEYERLEAADPATLRRMREKADPKLTEELTRQARTVIAALDERNRWVEAGRLRYHGDDHPTRRVIDCATFAKNLGTLADYIEAAQATAKSQP